MDRYRIYESVGARLERVRNYDDLEIHHPSQRGREPGRSYADVLGDREEVLRERTRSGQRLVSKDFILQDHTGNTRVRVPSPVSGVIGYIDPEQGRVDIYDRIGGELLVRVRHLDLRGSGLERGEAIAYGASLGLQSGFGGGNPNRYGVHVHFDFNAARIGQFDRYLRDIDRGAITPDGGRPTPEPVPTAERVLARGDRGAAVAQLQRRLRDLGYGDALRRALEPDGDFGERTTEAVIRFQRANDIEPDGRVGRDTRAALARGGVLQVGDTGAAVERLQRTLQALGVRDDAGRDLVVDGDFGERTRQAVMRFQRMHGLEADGRIGRDTRQRLDQLAAQRQASEGDPGLQQAIAAVGAMERANGLPTGAHSVRIAGALQCCAARDGLERIDRVEISDDRSQLRAVEVSRVRDEPGLNRASAPIATVDAAAMPLERSRDWLAALATRGDPHSPAPSRGAPQRG